MAIPWLTAGQPAAPNPGTSLANVTGPITADQLAMAMLGPNANQTNPNPAGMIGPYGTPTQDPTFGFATPGSSALSQADLQQWLNYFNSPGAQAGGGGGGGGQPTMQNRLVQTGSQFSPTIPWLTGGQGIGNIIGGNAPTNQTTSLNLPWGALGIQASSDPATMAANINASPFAGNNPANPYYNLILNAAGQGTNVPTFSMQSVPTAAPPGGPNQFAQVVGGQLIGNLTPEEQRMAMNFPGAYVPEFVNQMNALVQGGTAPQWAETQAMLGTIGTYAQQSGQNINALYQQAGLSSPTDRG